MQFNAFEMLTLFMPFRNQIMAVYTNFREVKKNKLMTLEICFARFIFINGKRFWEEKELF